MRPAQLLALREAQVERQERIEEDQHRAEIDRGMERVAIHDPGEPDQRQNREAREVCEELEQHGRQPTAFSMPAG